MGLTDCAAERAPEADTGLWLDGSKNHAEMKTRVVVNKADEDGTAQISTMYNVTHSS
jgi:hypothetical protein